MLATFFLGPQPFGPPKMSLVLRPPVAWSLILRTGSEAELGLLRRELGLPESLVDHLVNPHSVRVIVALAKVHNVLVCKGFFEVGFP